jgi:hypothetical protein
MNENYTDEDLQRAKEIMAMDTTARASRSQARISSSRTQRKLPADTEHGMDDSDNESDKSNWEHLLWGRREKE